MVFSDNEDDDGIARITMQRPLRFDPDHNMAAAAAATVTEEDYSAYRQLHEDVGAAVPNESLNQPVAGKNTNTVSYSTHRTRNMARRSQLFPPHT